MSYSPVSKSSKTPTRASPGKVVEEGSPGGKRTLDFDFWAERSAKLPKIVEEDLEVIRLEELEATKDLKQQIKLRCYATWDGSSFFKAALDDGQQVVIMTAFGDDGKRLRGEIKMDQWSIFQNLEVSQENPKYPTGGPNGFELYFRKKSVLVNSTEQESETVKYCLIGFDQIGEIPENTYIDVQGIVVKDWGRDVTSKGHERLQLSITDQSKRTLRVTFYGDLCSKLEDVTNKVLALKHVMVASGGGGTKCLVAKWFTLIKVDPDDDAAIELFTWFAEELNKVGDEEKVE